jgi:hypothetical protein
MATTIDQGPATGTGEFFFGQTAGVEVHIGVQPAGVNPLTPAQSPFIDPNTSWSGITGTQFTPINKLVNFPGASGASQTIVNPA